MARRRKFGASARVHAERATGEIREIRRLERLARENIRAGDCVRAAGLVHSLAQQEGAYWVDRNDSRGRSGSLSSVSRIFTRFVRACIRPAIVKAPRRAYGRYR